MTRGKFAYLLREFWAEHGDLFVYAEGYPENNVESIELRSEGDRGVSVELVPGFSEGLPRLRVSDLVREIERKPKEGVIKVNWDRDATAQPVEKVSFILTNGGVEVAGLWV
jgi:hypothetical protein